MNGQQSCQVQQKLHPQSNPNPIAIVFALQVFTYKFHGTHSRTENLLMRLSKKYWIPEGGVLHPRQLQREGKKRGFASEEPEKRV